MKHCLHWVKNDTAPEINRALEVLSQDYPFCSVEEGTLLRFVQGDELKVTVSDTEIVVTYNTMSAAMRGAGMALAGVDTDGESTPFTTFGVMLDCSRNAVMKVSYAKSVIAKLALMGYNLAMLYTEDTYQLPDEPHFGFLRGAYTLEEVKELDEYADSLGVELIGCIQTLGHMERFFNTKGSAPLRDTERIMLVGEEKTYELIAKMFDFWSKACRSRRIHIGMDEAHGLGTGKYADLHGHRPVYDIFNEHIARVCEMCEEYGLKPMIWSDMYYRMGSERHDYYDVNAVIPDYVVDAVPKNLELVYWDYYHLYPEFYDKMIQSHRQLGGEPLMGSGIWTWYRFCYDHKQTVDRANPCIDSCRKMGVKEFFFTIWGDNGAYCNFDTVLPGLLYAAERIYGRSGEEDARLDMLSEALGCVPFTQAVQASRMNYQAPHRDNGVSTASILMWDDLLLGIGWRKLNLDDEQTRCDFKRELKESIAYLKDLPYERAASRLLLAKIELREEMQKAYDNHDIGKIHDVWSLHIPKMIGLIDDFGTEFRRQWTAHNRYNGMESIQLRIGGMRARCDELGKRLRDYEKGLDDKIPELELVYDARCDSKGERYLDLVSMGVL